MPHSIKTCQIIQIQIQTEAKFSGGPKDQYYSQQTSTLQFEQHFRKDIDSEDIVGSLR